MTDVETECVIWRQHPDYPFIEVSNLGQVKTKDRYISCKNGVKRLVKGRILKQQQTREGYMYVCFRIDGKGVNLFVHRLVATTYIPNPNNLPEVDHIDCNPTNNVVNNLRWCTHQQNIAYRDKLGHFVNNTPGKSVIAVNLETGKVLRFESRSEASQHLGVCVESIFSVLRGRCRQAGGYLFVENESEITDKKIQEIRENMYFWGGVIAVDLKTYKVLYFESQHEAARQLGISLSGINNVLKRRQKKTHDHWFCYADEYAIEKVRTKFGDEIANRVEDLLNEI